MNQIKRLVGKIGFVFFTAFLGVLSGCVGYVDGPRYGGAYEHPPLVQDDYVYYPGYQVYYGSNTRQYFYRDGRSWVSRPAPPRVSADVLFRSPSVSLDFHDHPSIHHETVVRQYPKNWAPSGADHGRKEGRNDRN